MYLIECLVKTILNPKITVSNAFLKLKCLKYFVMKLSLRDYACLFFLWSVIVILLQFSFSESILISFPLFSLFPSIYVLFLKLVLFTAFNFQKCSR